MKITIESTPVIVQIDDGIAAHRWEGVTEDGIPVVALIVWVSPQTGVRITIESTPVIVEIDDGVAARRWEGVTEDGIPVVALVAGISPQTLDQRELARFTAELVEAAECAGEPDEDADDAPHLGACCVCECTILGHAVRTAPRPGNKVRNIIMLNRRAAVPGHGWGCPICHTPPDGAYAVLCDGCLAKWQADPVILTIACRGSPVIDGRIPIAELPPGNFDHDPSVDHG